MHSTHCSHTLRPFGEYMWLNPLKVKLLSRVRLCDPIDCSLPGSSVHGIFRAIVLEWIAISFSRGSSQPRDWTRVSRIVDRHFTIWATREVNPFKAPTETLKILDVSAEITYLVVCNISLVRRFPCLLNLPPTNLSGLPLFLVSPWFLILITSFHSGKLPGFTPIDGMLFFCVLYRLSEWLAYIRYKCRSLYFELIWYNCFSCLFDSAPSKD